MLLRTKTTLLPLSLILIGLIHRIHSNPRNDKDLYDEEQEARIGHRRRRPPCIGKNNADSSRTFFDWNVQYIDVNNHYNYNIDCGGGGAGGNKPGLLSNIGGGGGGHKPGGHHQGGGLLGNHQQGGGLLGNHQQGGGLLGNHQQGGGLLGSHQQGGGLLGSHQGLLGSLLGGGNQQQQDNGNNKPGGGGGSGIFGGSHQGGLFGGNGPLSGILQSQGSSGGGNPGLGGLFNGEGLGSLWPQGGLFNGQGIGSLFENGLFSNIFNRPPSAPPSAPNPPASIVTTAKPVDGQDPDDIIYNDERPVHEDHDDVVPDSYVYNKPGSQPNRHREFRDYNQQRNFRFF